MTKTTMMKKSAIAIAVTSVFALPAHAGTHTVDGEGDIVFANEIFGANSDETLIAIPDNTYDIDRTGHAAVADGDVLTVKYTLDSGAVFGEDLSDISKWADAAVNLSFVLGSSGADQTLNIGGVGSGTMNFNCAENSDNVDFVATVDSGGAIGDNTVTFRIDVSSTGGSCNTGAGAFDGDDTLNVANIGGFRTKNLKGALERGVANPAVRFGAEYRNVTEGDTDTQVAPVILRSQDGVELTGTATEYVENTGTIATERARIDVADGEVSFTGTADGNIGADASQDFDATDNVGFVQLGDLQIVRTEYDGAVTNNLTVKKENADPFDFQGSDMPQVTLTSSSVLDAYSTVYLRPAGMGNCTGTTAGTDFTASPADGSNEVTIDLSGESTTDLEAGYNVCGIADGSSQIPESDFNAELNVDYFNPRYTTSQDTLAFGNVLRNGCQVTLFNVPHPGAQDDAFIRLTNVSELAGSVRGFVWQQDGTQIDVDSQLSASLAGHATEIFHTNEDLAAGVYLGDVLPTYSNLASGRHRLVLQGAFPACEALGLVRSPSGTLTNMTSTTFSGDDGRLGTDQSNTSNTSN